MQDNYIIYVQDTETTGFDVGVAEIIEVSFLRIKKEKGKNNYEQKSWLIRAMNRELMDHKDVIQALAINGHKKEDIYGLSSFGKENYKLPKDVILEIEEWINQDGMSTYDRVFAGQNPLFDMKHMIEFWKALNSSDTFPFLTEHNKLILDTKELALFIDICLGRKREKYNLSSLVKAFGIKKGNAHRADEDARMTADLLMKFVDTIAPLIREAFS